jgi:DNA-directed RNA polymerase subunit M/transcription elongation factor TFIIS
MDVYRNKGLSALKLVLTKHSNVEIFERNIWNVSNGEEDYVGNIHQTIGDILSGNSLVETARNIKAGSIGWQHPAYEIIADRIKEQDEFIKNPFTVVEGVSECHCGSSRVFTYQKQTRSCDESSTTFAQCMACKKKWTYSG